MKKYNKKMKAYISGTFAFLLTILFSLLFISLGLLFGVFSNRSILSKLNESNYYTNVYTELDRSTEDMMRKAGFPADALKNVITQEKVYVGCKNYVNNTLAGNKADIKTEKLHKELKDNLATYLSNKGVVQDDQLKKDMDGLAAGIVDAYRSSVQLKFIPLITKYRIRYESLMKVLIPVLVALSGVLCFFLIRLHRYRHRGLRYISYALITSSLLILIASIYLITTKRYMMTDITPEYYKTFINTYLRWNTMLFLYIGGLGLLLSAALISLTGYLKNRINNS